MILLDFLAYVTFYDVVLCVLVVKKMQSKDSHKGAFIFC